MTEIPQHGLFEVPPGDRCRVGIIFALGLEAGGTVGQLADARHALREGLRIVRGLLSGRRVAVLQCGVGQQAAARGAEILIAGYRPDWIISTGVAGGLCEGVARGDFVLADAIVGGDGARFPLGTDGRDGLGSLEPTGRTTHRGQLLTVDRPICRPAEKRELGAQHGALAVDMESLAVARVCARERTRLLSVRVISDAVDDALPPEIEKLFGQRSAAGRAGAALGAIIKRPGSLPEMFRVKAQVRWASDQLAGVLARLVERLD